MDSGSTSLDRIQSTTGWNINLSIVDKNPSPPPLPPCPPGSPYCNIPLDKRYNLNTASSNNLYSFNVVYNIDESPFGIKYLRMKTYSNDEKGITAIQMKNIISDEKYFSVYKGMLLKASIAVRLVNDSSNDLNSLDIELSAFIFNENSIGAYNTTEVHLHITNKWIEIPVFVVIPENDNPVSLELNVIITPDGQEYMEDSVIDFDFTGVVIIQSIQEPLTIRLSQRSLAGNWTDWLLNSITNDNLQNLHIPGDYRTALSDLITKIINRTHQTWDVKIGYIVITRSIYPPYLQENGDVPTEFVTIATTISLIMHSSLEFANGMNVGSVEILRSNYSAYGLSDDTIDKPVNPRLRIEYPAISSIIMHDYENQLYNYSIKIKWGVNNIQLDPDTNKRFKIVRYEGNATIINKRIEELSYVSNDAIGSVANALDILSFILDIGSLVIPVDTIIVAGTTAIKVASILSGLSLALDAGGIILDAMAKPGKIFILKRITTIEDNLYSSSTSPATADTFFSYNVSTDNIILKGYDAIGFMSYYPDADPTNYIEIPYKDYITNISYNFFVANLTTYTWIRAIYFPQILLNKTGRNIYFKMIDENTSITVKGYISIVEHTTGPETVLTLNGYEMLDFVINYPSRVLGVNLSDT